MNHCPLVAWTFQLLRFGGTSIQLRFMLDKGGTQKEKTHKKNADQMRTGAIEMTHVFTCIHVCSHVLTCSHVAPKLQIGSCFKMAACSLQLQKCQPRSVFSASLIPERIPAAVAPSQVSVCPNIIVLFLYLRFGTGNHWDQLCLLADSRPPCERSAKHREESGPNTCSQGTCLNGADHAKAWS